MNGLTGVINDIKESIYSFIPVNLENALWLSYFSAPIRFHLNSLTQYFGFRYLSNRQQQQQPKRMQKRNIYVFRCRRSQIEWSTCLLLLGYCLFRWQTFYYFMRVCVQQIRNGSRKKKWKWKWRIVCFVQWKQIIISCLFETIVHTQVYLCIVL